LADIADALEPVERAAAKERQQEGARRGGQASGNFPEASAKGRALDKVAKAPDVVKKVGEFPRPFRPAEPSIT
jgi:hypothetical protein